MIVMGIDPGDSTGIAVIDTDLIALTPSFDSRGRPLRGAEPGAEKAFKCFSRTVGWSDLLNTQGTNKYTDEVLRQEVRQWNPDAFVIERLPRSLTPRMRSVFEYCMRVAQDYDPDFRPKLCLMTPGEWKPIAKLFPMPNKNYPPYEYTQHEKDAYRMACAWLWKQGYKAA